MALHEYTLMIERMLIASRAVSAACGGDKVGVRFASEIRIFALLQRNYRVVAAEDR